MEKKNIERLYKLLERADREHDAEVAAALRWAIFTLESQFETTDSKGCNDKIVDEIKRIQHRLEERTEQEKEAIRLMEQCRFEEANEILNKMVDF